jgi:hypothetical protein
VTIEKGPPWHRWIADVHRVQHNFGQEHPLTVTTIETTTIITELRTAHQLGHLHRLILERRFSGETRSTHHVAVPHHVGCEDAIDDSGARLPVPSVAYHALKAMLYACRKLEFSSLLYAAPAAARRRQGRRRYSVQGQP